MRRFAAWTTWHRKTVILGGIAALIVVGMVAGSVGSDFTEEFKLPSSDSQEAFDLLEHKLPQQSGVTAEIVYKAPGRGRLGGGEEEDGRPGWTASSPALHVEPAEGDPAPTGEHPVVESA